MNDFTTFANHDLFAADFAEEAKRFWRRESRILILVDGTIRVLPSPAPAIGLEFVISDEFGISTAIAALKNFSSGFSSFAVTVATRNGGLPKGHDITGFRFSDATLAAFDQVWMFGLNPGNIKPNSLDPADDALIEGPTTLALSDDELAALARWMDAGGGVFATGDHHFLGASMCHKVPRVSTMRRWTIADGVPTREFATRLDTNRPANSAQLAGLAVIPNDVQKDFVPQRIDWVPYSTRFSNFAFHSRPHPLLCHPTLGPIDILPDHPHEGICYDFADPAWQSGKRDLAFSFAGYSNDHYPVVDGARPLPTVVAWGTTLADPPLQFEKLDQPFRRFPLIAAYDGQGIGIGRVVVDSTWHHWFDMNLVGLEQRAQDTFDRRDIDRILRYFINVGVYLASADWRAGQTFGWLKRHQLGYFGQQEADLTAHAVVLGRAASAHLKQELGPCWVSEFVLDHLHSVATDVWATLKEKIGEPDPCLTCPPFELFEDAVLGEVVRALYSDMDDLRGQLAENGRISRSPLLKDLGEVTREAARIGLKAALDLHAEDLDRGREEVSRLAGKDY